MKIDRDNCEFIRDQIKDLCVESGNTWFLNHSFAQIALHDFNLLKKYHDEDLFDTDEFIDVKHECFGMLECTPCMVSLRRDDDLENSGIFLNKTQNYDYDIDIYYRSKWIIADMINGEIPGFILLRCGTNFEDDVFTHELYFAFVKSEYRKRGILKQMLNEIPKEWKVWLEANSTETENIGSIWGKCGFKYYKTINNQFEIYERII